MGKGEGLINSAKYADVEEEIHGPCSQNKGKQVEGDGHGKWLIGRDRNMPVQLFQDKYSFPFTDEGGGM